MQHGADARDGVYPHRPPTTALPIASQRGYDEIVRITEEEEEDEEQKRRDPQSGATGTPRATPLQVAAETYNADSGAAAVARGDEQWIRARHAAAP